MNEITLTNLLDVAVCAAEAAGNHALKNKHRRSETNEDFAHDIKLVLDVECQKVAEKIISEAFSGHSILGEENAYSAGDDTYEWIIDPIDGTLNFSRGFPYWCCSIAVRRNGQVLAGCVYAPEFGALYTATIESPARLNGEPIQVSETCNLKNALVFTGLPKDFETEHEMHFGKFSRLAGDTKKLRINGAAALDICHVADGIADGFFESGIYIWDFAAGALIAERAGGRFNSFPNADGTHAVLCSNEHLIGGLLAIQNQA
ncbi:MAG: inositol monophosphatase [Pontiellaceae bacterium]|nr:inositol monophosphatase [Pontiellaceae bacterium]MBN2784273.1 inositol monophosphatase [Pontiellaceae bacterium]